MNKKDHFILSEETLPIVEQLADCMPGGFFIYKADSSEEILYANKPVMDIFGCSDYDEFRRITGNTFRGMIHPDDLEEVERSISEQISGNSSNLDYVEYRIIRTDGIIRYVDDYGHFVHSDDYGDLYYVFINDATDKRLAEKLERERQVNSAKMNFLFNISHDIRTPMNSIMGFTALAKSHINDPELLADYLDKVDTSNRHMISLIDDILEMSSIESGRISIKTDVCSLSAQISAVVGMVLPQAKVKHISVESDINIPDDPVCVDSARFRRVLSNLMSNAVKFTGEGGFVRISASVSEVTPSGHNVYEIKVSDNGIGMSEEFLSRIFRVFERERSSTETGYPGTGLGLSITKSLLDLMGGSISVVSKKGEGSEFTVKLPLKTAEKDAWAGKSPDSLGSADISRNNGRRILIAEDIEINRMLAETVLRKYGFAAESAVDGCEAVDAVRDHPEGYYDLVLMDIQMPKMNGYEAARAIRALGSEYAEKLPIIALSANAGAEDRRMSIESGMDSHIAKPFEIANLIMTVTEYIDRRKNSATV